MSAILISFGAGVLFALGLGIGGMTQPAKVLAFLDIFGNWDPSLAFVMGGAIVVYVPAYRWATRMTRPLFDARFVLPERRDIDRRLVAGAALFGVGWGAVGYCPGPAVTSIGSGDLRPIVFVAAMMAGMLIEQRAKRKRTVGALAVGADY